MGAAGRDSYTSPLDAPSHWWSGLSNQRVLAVAGGVEVFVDVEAFFKKLQVRAAPPFIIAMLIAFSQSLEECPVKIFVAPGECLDEPIFGRMFGNGQIAQTTKIYNWLLDEVLT